jgi:uncharacterized protein
VPESRTATRLAALPHVRVAGREVPVAIGLRARLFGLAGIDVGAAGPGLLIPRCSGVHTFGMRFALDLVFLDRGWRTVAVRASVPPRRLVGHRGAAAVLELPAGARCGERGNPGGESGNARLGSGHASRTARGRPDSRLRG